MRSIAHKSFSAIILTALMLFTLCTASLFAQDGDASDDGDASTLQGRPNPWPAMQRLGDGNLPSVAIHSSGLIIEVNQLGDNIHTFKGLYYRVGRLDPVSGVSWGPSHELKGKSDFSMHPSVAITKEGYVVIVYSNLGNHYGQLRYYVGTLDPNGSISQTLNFKVFDEYYDRGYFGAISVNYNGTIAEVHQEGSDTYNKELYYRLGHLTAPGTGDFSITWDTGEGGKYYEKGQTPAISINDNGDVIEFHIVPNERKIHYIRGRLSGNTISFQSVHPRFASDDYAPTVALQNNGYVLTFHVYPKRDILRSLIDYELKYRLSKLDLNDPAHIVYDSEYQLWSTPRGGAIATNGNFAVAVAADGVGEMKYTWSIAP